MRRFRKRTFKAAAVLVAILCLVFLGKILAANITTRSGTTYKQAVITGVDGDGVRVTHSYGVIKIPFGDLPESLRKKYLSDQEGTPATSPPDGTQPPFKASPSTIPVLPSTTPKASELATVPIKSQRINAVPTPVIANPAPNALVPVRTSHLFEPLPILVGFLLTGAVAVAVSIKIKEGGRRKTVRERLAAELNAYLSNATTAGALPKVPTQVMLKPGESAFYDSASALFETRAVRQYQGGRAGFKIAKGVWVGGSQGQSVSTQKWSKIDNGRLTITNVRLLFDGSQENRAVQIAKVVSVQPLLDAIEISVENRQKSMVFSAPNPFIAAAILRSVCKHHSAATA